MSKKSTGSQQERYSKKKNAKTPCTVRIFVEGHGKQYDVTDIAQRTLAAYAETNPDKNPETLDIYCKVDDGHAYYAVDGEGSPESKVSM